MAEVKGRCFVLYGINIENRWLQVMLNILRHLCRWTKVTYELYFWIILK